jgi:rhodanese-related sulfurtransferase
MEPSQAKDLLGRAVFLDVREPYEWEAGHVEGAVHIPIGQITLRVAELEPRDDIVVVCQIGQRSALVTDWLNERGYKAQNLEGGLAAWSAHGLPLVSGADEGQLMDGWGRDLTGERLDPDER